MTRRPTSDPTFRDLVEQHHAAVWRSAQRIVRDPNDAADVTQQVYVAVLEGARLDVDVPERSLCWLASRLALNVLRDRTRRRRRHEEHATMNRDRDAMPSTIERAADRERRERVMRALDDLPDDLRLPLILRFQEGMTFAVAADAMACAESTLHERVGRGLERLRTRLRDIGFGALADGALPELLGAACEAPTAAGIDDGLPVELVDRLLALESAVPASASSAGIGAAAAATVPWSVAIGILAAAALGLSAWLVIDVGGGADVPPPPNAAASTGPRSDVRAIDETVAAVASTAEVAALRTALETTATDQDPEPPAMPTGRVHGRVVDEAGAALTGVRVVGQSYERHGKAARFGGHVETDATGAFSLELPVRHERGQRYRLLVSSPDYTTERVEEVSLLAAEVNELEAPVVLRAWVEDRAGDYRLGVTVLDGSAAPVAGADVEIYRLPKDGGSVGQKAREAAVRTDANGRCELVAARLGEKVLRIRAVGANLQPTEQRFAISARGAHERVVTLRAGLEIAGRVRALAADAPPIGDGFFLGLERERIDDREMPLRLDGRTGADGTFRFRGLPPGRYTLRSVTGGWSQFTRRGIAAGSLDLDLVVKRPDDVRLGAAHDGELHGRAVDAVTGAPVDLDYWSIDVRWLDPDGDDAAFWTDEAPALLAPSIAQRMAIMTPPPPNPTFHRTGLRPGRYALTARVDGYAPAILGPFTIRGADLIDGIVARLHRGGRVLGRVVDERGRPIVGARVVVMPAGGRGEADPAARLAAFDALLADPQRDGRALWRSERVDADGAFALGPFPPDLPVLVFAGAEAWRAARIPTALTLRDGHDERVELRLQPRR